MNVPIKVLIVEDDSMSLMVVEYLAKMHELEPVSATDVATARLLFAETNPGIAIVDVVLPDGYGTELLPEIRRAHPSTTVAIITGSHDKSVLQECWACEPDAMFMKPLDINTVGNWLEAQKTRLSMRANDCVSA